MADLLISYARDGEATAERLSTLLRQEGFSIWSEAAARGPIQDRVGDVRAAVVIWSQAARGSEWIKAEANYARGQKKLVQVSIDGEPPPMPFEAEAVAALAGWSGDEGDPGWLRLRSELEGLCRRRTPQPAAAAVPDKPAAAAAPPPRPEARRSGGGMRGVLAFFALFAVAGAAFLWMRSGPPFGSDGSPPATSQVERAPAAERPAESVPSTAPPPAVAPEPVIAAEEGVETVPADDEPAPTAEEDAAPPVQQRPPSQVQQRPPSQVQQRPAAQPRPAPSPAAGRINRRNSRTMRLFCERAGRGTPQCREFERRLRSQSR